MLATTCQRWRDRAARYRPAGEVFDPSRAYVASIDEKTAKAFVTRHHYSGSYPAARCRVGLFWKPAHGLEQLAGVAVFSVPMNQLAVPHYFDDLEPNAGVELGRLVLLDDVPANGESWFMARAFRIMRDELAGVRGVVSYSDPVERVGADGAVVKPGHVGTVYQALNGRYRGRASPRTMIVARDGRFLSHRALSKLRTDDRGAGYAYAQLRELGAPERRPLESGAEYLRRALHDGDFRRVRHPGNHVYTWRLDGRAACPSLPFPKRNQAKGDVK